MGPISARSAGQFFPLFTFSSERFSFHVVVDGAARSRDAPHEPPLSDTMYAAKRALKPAAQFGAAAAYRQVRPSARPSQD